MNSLEEINNINLDIHRIYITSRERDIVRRIRAMANDTCRGSISPDYIHASFNKFKQGIVYYINNKIHGFCIWKVREHTRPDLSTCKELHIYLVCAKKTTKPFLQVIINDVEDYCMHNNIDFISLYPINKSIEDYYASYGFKKNSNDIQLMTKNISIMPIHKSTMTRRRIRSRGGQI